jgi:methylated-DNA-[protein]-cysteine S-methyltransferase
MSIRHTMTDFGMGPVTLVADGDAITGLYFEHHWYKPAQESFGPAMDAGSDRLFAETIRQLRQYLTGDREALDLPTATHGDAFQERVWTLLKEIPYGSTTTYGEIAARLGDRSMAYQVGQAVGRNPLCVIVPCHRVVGRGGRPTGYAGGLKRKQLLLDLETPVEAKTRPSSVAPDLTL